MDRQRRVCRHPRVYTSGIYIALNEDGARLFITLATSNGLLAVGFTAALRTKPDTDWHVLARRCNEYLSAAGDRPTISVFIVIILLGISIRSTVYKYAFANRFTAI